MRVTTTLMLTKHTCNISDKVCSLHSHRQIRTTVRYFLGENSDSSSSSSLSNAVFENVGSHLNNQVNADTSDKNLCLSPESERNTAKRDRWSDQ